MIGRESFELLSAVPLQTRIDLQQYRDYAALDVH
jgi:hypothetical protein